jgi:hypothetical protein
MSHFGSQNADAAARRWAQFAVLRPSELRGLGNLVVAELCVGGRRGDFLIHRIDPAPTLENDDVVQGDPQDVLAGLEEPGLLDLDGDVGRELGLAVLAVQNVEDDAGLALEFGRLCRSRVENVETRFRHFHTPDRVIVVRSNFSNQRCRNQS